MITSNLPPQKPDTTVEYTIPVKKQTSDKKIYYGWLVKSKEVGWFFTTDKKWATKTDTILYKK